MSNLLNVTVDHLTHSYEGNLDPNKHDFYQAKIDEAARMLIHKRRALVDRLQKGQVDQGIVIDVVIRAVERFLRNPRGIQTESDDGYSYTLNPTYASGDIWFPDSDLNLIYQRPLPARTVTVRPSRNFSPVPRGWSYW